MLPREILWRLPKWANERFIELALQMDKLEPDSDNAYAIRDEIRSLPNYPREATELDVIYREITTV